MKKLKLFSILLVYGLLAAGCEDLNKSSQDGNNSGVSELTVTVTGLPGKAGKFLHVSVYKPNTSGIIGSTPSGEYVKIEGNSVAAHPTPTARANSKLTPNGIYDIKIEFSDTDSTADYILSRCSKKFYGIQFNKGAATVEDDTLWWTEITSADLGYFEGIAYGGKGSNARFVMLRRDLKAYSRNGIDWTTVPLETGDALIDAKSIVYGGEGGNAKFVAVGNEGKGSYPIVGKMAYSNDGIDWTLIPDGTGAGTTNFNRTGINGITYGGEGGDAKFVAVGDAGKMAYSNDGIDWTLIPAGTGAGTTNFDSTGINGITYGGKGGNAKFVAVGDAGKIAYSNDGIDWTLIPAGTGADRSNFGTTTINGITYGSEGSNAKFVSVGDTGKMAYSNDGIDWTLIPAGRGEGTTTFGSTINDIVYGSGKFVAVGVYSYKAYSSNGIDWTDGMVGKNNSCIVYGDGKFVAGGGYSSEYCIYP
ncbi:hypothetical protein AGMMS50212_13810 [Spirochaetia bacterium]|nr:hypothetical protein AGMMS50212_13810 [Spirochaetia bacterium]